MAAHTVRIRIAHSIIIHIDQIRPPALCRFFDGVHVHSRIGHTPETSFIEAEAIKTDPSGLSCAYKTCKFVNNC